MGDLVDALNDWIGTIRFRQHPAIVRRAAEQRGIKGDRGQRKNSQWAAEIEWCYFRTLGHADLIEDQSWRRVIGAKLLQRIDQVFCIA